MNTDDKLTDDKLYELEVAQLVVSLYDFVMRWFAYENHHKQLAREWLKQLNLPQGTIIESFLDALDGPWGDDGDDGDDQ